ncbi:MAG: SpoVG family protein [Clostridia bacterium]|nr:SpoVG family protein [Clostridia bacterium]
MQITDIKIRKTFSGEGPMKAIVSVTFDNELALHDVKVINTKDKFFIVMPSRKNPDGSFRDIIHPINSDFRTRLEEQVINAYFAELKRIEEEGEDIASDDIPSASEE